MSPIHNVRLVRMLDAIPLLGTGKTDYQALKAMVGQG
jgi:long-chain-fatty-acid--[acyl-carrier-protein] ligase